MVMHIEHEFPYFVFTPARVCDFRQQNKSARKTRKDVHKYVIKRGIINEPKYWNAATASGKRHVESNEKLARGLWAYVKRSFFKF